MWHWNVLSLDEMRWNGMRWNGMGWDGMGHDTTWYNRILKPSRHRNGFKSLRIWNHLEVKVQPNMIGYQLYGWYGCLIRMSDPSGDQLFLRQCEDILSTIYLITSSLNESSSWLLLSNRMYEYMLAVGHCVYARPVYFPSYSPDFSSSSNFWLLYIRIHTVYVFFITTLTFLSPLLQP